MSDIKRALPFSKLQQRNVLNKVLVTSLALFITLLFLAPLGYMFTTALKSETQMSDPGVPFWWPFSRVTFDYQGKALEVYRVPTETGIRELAMFKKTRTESWFIDPANPTADQIHWVGNWRLLEPAYKSDPQWQNFEKAWTDLNFPRLFVNSLIIAGVGTFGAVLSSILVAYGFSRFNFRGKNALFMILIASIILPAQVTLIPTYILFAKIGWTNTFLPLIVPHFFANAYNVFLLRQYFMQIPREMDEAAMIDGANPFQVLTKVILPQSIPALTAVCLFHFFFAWNDFFTPLIYLASKPELWPLSVGLQKFNALYGRLPNLIQTGALITLVLPVVVFFLAQRVFMQGVVFTGVEK
ncbi:MAG TPA: carbohydrate ABC transporter permease [Anaerolineaceae bacterium]|nr:carbohydrate ABC transporter permease [Anaerolineaceae bacterium]